MRKAIKMGRKKSDDPRNKILKVRLTEFEHNYITDLCKRIGCTKADLFRSLLVMYLSDPAWKNKQGRENDG